MNTDSIWNHQVRTSGDRTTVELAGEFDMNSARQLQDLLQKAVESTDTTEVDLARVSFIDSTTISALIAAWNTANDTGHHFSVINLSRPARRALAITGLLGLLTADTPGKTPAEPPPALPDGSGTGHHARNGAGYRVRHTAGPDLGRP
ncbi:MAG TPA: STAS domain-containing protein [Micromonospora sp.]